MDSKEDVLSRKTVLGYPLSDIAGIFLMFIPFIISIVWQYNKKFLFITVKTISIRPDLIMSLAAGAFYLALIIRYDFFKKETMLDIIISVIRAFLDIWVLASFFAFCLPTKNEFSYVVLVMSVLFSWLGIRSVAGYGWIFVIITGAKQMVSTSKLMGMTGAVYIIFIIISLILQVASASDFKNFFLEFNGKSAKGREFVRESMEEAANETKHMVKQAAEIVIKEIDKRNTEKPWDEAQE